MNVLTVLPAALLVAALSAQLPQTSLDAFLVGPAVEAQARAGAARPSGFVTTCQDSSPRLARLASAIEDGDVAFVRIAVNTGGDVNETWRDFPAQICRSLLLRSIWYGQEGIFRLLLDRGAELSTVPGESLQIPVRNAHVDMVKTLFELGLRPHDTDEIARAGLESRNLPMIDLLISRGVSITATNVPASALTDEIARHLVPRHIGPNDTAGLGNESCTAQELFGLLHEDQDGCEWSLGPLWLHFVTTGNVRMVEFMIANGADLTLGAAVWDGGDMKPFTAMDVAVARGDAPMIDLLRRRGATERRWARSPH